MPTAAAIIIGNEILTGKFADENGPFLVERLRTLGVDLLRVVTLADDRDAIAREVAHCSQHFDVVFTSGGVGPTHDDVTLESVAQAFGVPAVPAQPLVDILAAAGLTDPHALRMATVPEGTDLLWEADATYPVLRMRNVYVLPGVPPLFRAKFELVAYRFAGEQVHTARLFTDERETAIAARLSDAQDAHPDVDIGSYPRFGEGPWRVIVTLESRDEDALVRADAALRQVLHLVDGPDRADDRAG